MIAIESAVRGGASELRADQYGSSISITNTAAAPETVARMRVSKPSEPRIAGSLGARAGDYRTRCVAGAKATQNVGREGELGQ